MRITTKLWIRRIVYSHSTETPLIWHCSACMDTPMKRKFTNLIHVLLPIYRKRARRLIDEIKNADLTMKINQDKQERMRLTDALASRRLPQIEAEPFVTDHVK